MDMNLLMKSIVSALNRTKISICAHQDYVNHKIKDIHACVQEHIMILQIALDFAKKEIMIKLILGLASVIQIGIMIIIRWGVCVQRRAIHIAFVMKEKMTFQNVTQYVKIVNIHVNNMTIVVVYVHLKMMIVWKEHYNVFQEVISVHIHKTASHNYARTKINKDHAYAQEIPIQILKAVEIICATKVNSQDLMIVKFAQVGHFMILLLLDATRYYAQIRIRYFHVSAAVIQIVIHQIAYALDRLIKKL
ncbi:MAG: hypothetical protein EZS28_048578, partial [Streblomastix strix]